MIVYFTGTGNSRYCAQFLAHRLGEVCIDAFHFLRDGIAPELCSETPWIFVSPTYGWQLPRIFADFIRGGTFGGSRDAYFLMTCGSEIGNAAPEIRALCREKGLLCHGVLPVVMPENYIAMFQAPEEPEARRIIAAAHPALEQAAAAVRNGRDFPESRAGLADKLKSGPVNRAFYRFIIRADPFTALDHCVGCGKCQAVCPLGNIRMKNGKPQWGGRCTHCMACICGCPFSAIEYGNASRGKPRYQCPEYRG